MISINGFVYQQKNKKKEVGIQTVYKIYFQAQAVRVASILLRLRRLGYKLVTNNLQDLAVGFVSTSFRLDARGPRGIAEGARTHPANL